MLTVHDKKAFHDDGTPRRRHELDDTDGGGRTGLRVVVGLAIAGSLIWLKNALTAAQKPAEDTSQALAPHDDEGDGTVPSEMSEVAPVDDPPQEDDTSGEISPPGVATGPRFRSSGSADIPLDYVKKLAAARANDDQSAFVSGGTAVTSANTASLFPQLAEWRAEGAGASAGGQEASSAGDGAPKGDGAGGGTKTPPEPDTGTGATNRRPYSTGVLSLGAILMNAHLALSLAELLANTRDDDGDTLTVSELTASSGTLTMNADGSWHYLAQYDAVGPVEFQYVVSDGQSEVQQTASLTITPPTIKVIEGTSIDSELSGSTGRDHLAAGVGADVVQAGAGDDGIFGSEGDDVIFAGDGNDIVWAGAGNDVVHGGAGNDTIFGEAGDDTLSGNDGHDVLHGGAGNDRLDGGVGNDVLSGDEGNDTIHGGAGNDIIFGEAGDDTLFGENGDDVVHGGAGNDQLDGGAGNDVLYGDEGDDVLLASAGMDQVDGGSGQDTFVTTHVSSSVTIDLAAGAATISAVDTTVIANIESVETGAGDDIVTGDAAANTIITGAGDDSVASGGGADAVAAGAGHDIIEVSSDGAVDVLDGGAGIDTVDTTRETTGVVINFATGTITFHRDEDEIRDIENVRTGAGADVVVGDASANHIETGAGDDTVDAGDGADRIALDAGNDRAVVRVDAVNDVIDGGAGRDTLDVSTIEMAVVVDLAHGWVDVGDGERDCVTAFEIVQTGSGDDTIVANDAVNEFFGGAGNDTFVFLSSRGTGNGEGSRDRISDFETGDRIDIERLMHEFECSGDADPRLLFFTLLNGPDRAFTQPGELRINSVYENFDGAPSVMVMDGNLDRDADTEFQIELAGDVNAIRSFFETSYGQAIA